MESYQSVINWIIINNQLDILETKEFSYAKYCIIGRHFNELLNQIGFYEVYSNNDRCSSTVATLF